MPTGVLQSSHLPSPIGIDGACYSYDPGFTIPSDGELICVSSGGSGRCWVTGYFTD